MERLVKKAQKGDKDAFVELIESSKLTLIRTAGSILKNDEDIADALQEATLRAYQKLSTLKERRYFKTWLVRILIHTCYDMLESRRRFVPMAEMDAGSYEENSDDTLDIRQSLDRMQENDRLVLTLFYLEDLSVRDVSEALGISDNAVKLRLSRGRKRFKAVYLEKGALCHEI